VTAARAATFYAKWGVPDTLAGRFEMVALHVALLLHRLASVKPPDRRLSVALTEAFVVDLDDSMRELTFGDLAVPREIKRATAALFDRHGAYLAALAGNSDISLADALKAQLAYLGAGALSAAAFVPAGAPLALRIHNFRERARELRRARFPYALAIAFGALAAVAQRGDLQAALAYLTGERP